MSSAAETDNIIYHHTTQYDVTRQSRHEKAAKYVGYYINNTYETNNTDSVTH